MACDVRVQIRNGFYYAAGFVAVYWMLLLLWPDQEDLVWILPVLIFTNLMINTFYFFSGLVLLEKREGTLEAQIVTPLRNREYLVSKLITLTGLGVLENLIITLVSYGTDFALLPLVVGMVLAATIYCLVGFAFVARYDSINEFLMPSMLVFVVFVVPLLPYFGYLPGWWHYLHPMMGPLLLMKAAFQPVDGWQLAYGILYPLLWIAPLIRWSRHAFYRFIVAREGARS
jgi:fluoroquinolone transport system permease protein